MDFILETPEGIEGLEIKTSQTVMPSDSTGLRGLSAVLSQGRSFLRGVDLYGGTDLKSLGVGIYAIPWSHFGFEVLNVI